MPQLNISITLDNIDSEIDANQLASTIENIIRQNSGIDNIQTSIYDNDGSNSGNPIMAQNIMRKIK
ncbi:MAG TPA: hypothetical protein VI911_11120 [Patescibacteria group bacterium]|nr:hypothetical protein [Patescibacteria group bacterium]